MILKFCKYFFSMLAFAYGLVWVMTRGIGLFVRYIQEHCPTVNEFMINYGQLIAVGAFVVPMLAFLAWLMADE